MSALTAITERIGSLKLSERFRQNIGRKLSRSPTRVGSTESNIPDRQIYEQHDRTVSDSVVTAIAAVHQSTDSGTLQDEFIAPAVTRSFSKVRYTVS
ncbi:unnamed protein product [Enterobius vermicularis]|uniref:Uncharacterized protein n=1 Tax=Enterobius vermicularis TaxID=51028 RepID=A0A0N4UZV7_ENTVE|nr:unnamed protein product [Enterobius vermicularis]